MGKIYRWLFIQWMTFGYNMHQSGHDVSNFIYKPILNFLAKNADFSEEE